MEINYSEIVTKNTFEKAYSPIIESELYSEILDQSECFKQKFATNYEKIDNHYTSVPEKDISPYEKVLRLNDWLRNYKDEIGKQLIIINTLISDDIVKRILENNNISKSDFIEELNKVILFSRIIKGKDMKKMDKNVNAVLSTFANYCGITNYNFFVLRVYELQKKEELSKNQKQMIKQK